MLFSSSLSSSAVSSSSLEAFKLLLTDVLLAGWGSKLTRLDSGGADVTVFAGEEDEGEDGDRDTFLLFVTTKVSENLLRDS